MIDTFQQVALFIIRGALQTRNTIVLPFLITTEIWVSEFWDPFDISTGTTIPLVRGTDVVYLGGYKGDIYEWWEGENDGINAGQKSGNVPVAGARIGDTSITLTTTIVRWQCG